MLQYRQIQKLMRMENQVPATEDKDLQEVDVNLEPFLFLLLLICVFFSIIEFLFAAMGSAMSQQVVAPGKETTESKRFAKFSSVVQIKINSFFFPT